MKNYRKRRQNGVAESGVKRWERNPELLSRAMDCWEGLADYRRERERNKRFTYGDQWGDMIEVDGMKVREEEYIRMQGNVPLKNNMIRRIVRNVLGVFRSRYEERYVNHEGGGTPELLEAMKRNRELNMMEEVYARTMEEFLIGGLAVHRKWFGTKGRTTACWTDIVLPDNFFCDTEARDFRNRDVRLVGEIHDLDIDTVCASFARSEEDCAMLRRLYGDAPKRQCRVGEVWSREYKGRYLCHDRLTGRFYERSSEEIERLESDMDMMEDRRWAVKEVWVCHFLAPGGEVLLKGESPYAHGGHPYVFKAYPFIDGEIHSFVSDIIDQQKFTNRLISMYDWILRASAKGVLLFPEGALPEGADINDVAEEWSRFNGVIMFRPKAGQPLPQQVSSNCTNIGITELLNIQLKMMEDISGVNGALQGKLESSSMSGTLYNQQTQNALISLADLLKSFESFISDATAMDISNLLQFGR